MSFSAGFSLYTCYLRLQFTFVALSDPALTWISGSVIRVDGGEDIVT